MADNYTTKLIFDCVWIGLGCITLIMFTIIYASVQHDNRIACSTMQHAPENNSMIP